MSRRTSSALAFSTSVLAATLAATVMAASAFADDITIDSTPFVGAKTRDQVKSEFMSQRNLYSNAGYEWTLQHNTPQPMVSSYTRDQVRAEYIASRDKVRAMTSEDSGSATLAQISVPTHRGTMLAKSSR